MTWANIVTEGNGPIEYRISIEGFDYDFVTNQRMSNNSTYPLRMNGLVREGLKLNQSLKLPEPILDLNSNTFTIVDYQEQATIAFYRTPTWSGNLMQQMDLTQTTMLVDNATGLSIGDYLWIGQEVVKILAIDTANINTLIVLRAQLGTTATSHFNTTDLGILVRPSIQNCPFTIERRRMFLYAYGLGDDLQGDGTLIWRGICKTQPRFQGTKYSIDAGPITELLKSSIGVDGDDVKLKGINLGNFPWTITVELVQMNSNGTLNQRIKTTSEIDLTSDLGLNPVAYFETVQDFIVNANQKIQLTVLAELFDSAPGSVLISGIGVTNENELVFISSLDVAGYGLMYRTLKNPLRQGTTDPDDIGFDYFATDTNLDWTPFTDGSANQVSITYPAANKLYCQPLRNRAKPFPSQMMIVQNTTPGTQNEGTKLHLSNYGLTTLVDSILINKEDVLVASTVSFNRNQLVSFDLTNNILIVPGFSIPASSPNSQQIPIVNNNYKISIGTSFINSISVQGGQVVTGTNTYNVIGFIRFLIEQTPKFVNSGLIPLLTEQDFDLDDMQTVFDSLSLKSIQNNRAFAFYKKIESLEKLLAEEFKLIGVYPALTYDGKITIRKLKNINTVQTPDYTLNSGDILTDNSYPSIDTNKFGIWNSIAISTLYNPMNQKWEGTTWVQNNVDAISQYGKQNQITVKPLSSVLQQNGSYQNESELNDYADIMLRSTSMLSKDYWYLTVDIPMKYFYLNIGAVIRIKNKQLPNYQPNFSYLTSRRGNGNIVGILVSKEFDLAKGFGTIGLLVTDREYVSTDANTKTILAPDALSNGIVSQGSTIYKVTLDSATSALYMAGTDTNESLWFVGDGVRFDEFDSTSANKGSGSVLAISGSGNAITLTVNMSTTPTNFTTRQFYIRPTDFNSSLTSQRQLQYGFYDGGSVGTNNVNFPSSTIKRILAF